MHSANTAAGGRPQEDQGTLTKAILLQIFILGGGFFFYMLNRFAFPIGLGSIGKTYGFNAVEISALGTVLLLGQGIIDIPAGYMADHLNRRMLFSVSLFFTGLTVICFTLFTRGFVSAVSWRIAFGLVEGVFNICLFGTLGALLPKRRGSLNTLITLFGGGLVGPVLFSYIFTRVHQWQLPLQIFAAATMVYALVMLFTLRVERKDSPTRAFHKIPEGETFFRVLKTMATRSATWKAMTIFLFNNITQWGYAGVGAYMLTKVKGVDIMFAGGVIGTAFGLGPLVQPFLGYTTDRIGRKPVIVPLSLIVAASMWVLFASDIVNKPVLLVAAFLSGVGINAIYTLGYTVSQDAAPPHYIGFATGMTGAVGYFVASFSGWAIGIVTKYFGHLTAVYGILIGSELLVALCAILWIPSKRKLEGQA